MVDRDSKCMYQIICLASLGASGLILLLISALFSELEVPPNSILFIFLVLAGGICILIITILHFTEEKSKKIPLHIPKDQKTGNLRPIHQSPSYNLPVVQKSNTTESTHYCPECGAIIKDRFCTQCGQQNS